MGWNPFKSKTKTETVVTMQTSVSRVLEDNYVKSSLKSGLAKSLINEDDLISNVLEDFVSGMAVQASSLYRYGKNTYKHGVPTQTIVKMSDANATAKDLLESIEGSVVTLSYLHSGALNNQHYAWKTLCDAHGYNQTTNILGNLATTKGTSVFLEDIIIVVKDALTEEYDNESLSRWGDSPRWGKSPTRPVAGSKLFSPIRIDPNISEDYFEIQYSWIENNNPKFGSFTFEFLNPFKEKSYFQIKYSVEGVIKYFTYCIGEGTYIELDNAYNTSNNATGSFFPYGYFRMEKKNLSTDKTSLEYKHQKKYHKLLGLDFDSICSSIHENPDIADIESAVTMFAVPAETTNQAEQEYLYEFFSGVYLQIGKVTSSVGDPANNTALVIKDDLFGVSFSFSSINYKVKVGNGSIDSTPLTIGSFSSGKGTENGIVNISGLIGYNELSEPIYGETPTAVVVPYHFYRKQITSNTYAEVRVGNISTSYSIKTSFVKATGDDLLIPLDFSITNTLPTTIKEELYARALHFIINAYIVRTYTYKVSWYQSGVFKTVITIAAIAMTVVSMGTDGGSWIALASAAVGTGAVYYATYLTIVFATSLVIQAAIKVFVKIVGPEVGMALAVIAVAYGAYQGFTTTEGFNAFDTKLLLSVGNGLVTEASKVKLEEMYELLENEYSSFNIYMDSKNKELEAATKLLDNDSVLAPLIVLGERPSDYYLRTVHSGNIGVLSYASVSDYVSMSLKLPSFYQTMEL